MSITQSVTVENLKCGGCVNTITKGLNKIQGVTNVMVDPDHAEVRFDSTPEVRMRALKKLQDLGYPEAGHLHGLQSTAAAAKSYVSCALGKMT